MDQSACHGRKRRDFAPARFPGRARPDVLRQESAKAEAVLHLGFIHDFGMDFAEILRIDGAAVVSRPDCQTVALSVLPGILSRKRLKPR